MKVIGLTGGMGSGKTTVANFFKELGIPVYIADDQAKSLMNTSAEVKSKIIGLLGKKAYPDGILDRKYVAAQVFNSEEKLEKLNSIVHPAVANDFENWKNSQNSPYVIYEAAILFEKGGNKKCDAVILVTAPYEERIKRIKSRDKSSEEDIEARMKHQWSDSKKRKLADFQIKNLNLRNTRERVRKLHEIILISDKN
ncbi:MAG TPA: dephospho-CoA kinase [Gillisia sp.]|nr:dephospho-CoA kinase [Gillisia sp.]